MGPTRDAERADAFVDEHLEHAVAEERLGGHEGEDEVRGRDAVREDDGRGGRVGDGAVNFLDDHARG